MSPELLVLIAQILLKYGPAAAAAFQKIFATTNPTQSEWDAAFALAQKSYDSYVSPPIT